MKQHQCLDASLSFHANEFSWRYKPKTFWITDLSYFWSFQEFGILLGKGTDQQPAPEGTATRMQAVAGSGLGITPHTPLRANSLPEGAPSPPRQPVVAIFTSVFLQSRAGGAAVPPVLPPGAWMGL